MRRATAVLILPFLIACGPKNEQAQQTTPPAGSGGMAQAPAAPPAAAPQVMPASEMTIMAEVVQADATGKTLTVRDAPVAGVPADTARPEKQIAVDAGAVTALGSLRAGDAVAVTCSANITVPVGGTTPAPAATASITACERVTGVAPADTKAATTGEVSPGGAAR